MKGACGHEPRNFLSNPSKVVSSIRTPHYPVRVPAHGAQNRAKRSTLCDFFGMTCIFVELNQEYELGKDYIDSGSFYPEMVK